MFSMRKEDEDSKAPDAKTDQTDKAMLVVIRGYMAGRGGESNEPAGGCTTFD